MLKSIVIVAAITGVAASATAQTGAGPTLPSRMEGLAGLNGRDLLSGSALSKGIPNVGSVGAGNAAGLLGYCLKNNLLGAAQAAGGTATTGTPAKAPAAPATGAQSILERLTGRQGVATSPGFAAGQAGQVQTSGGQALSLDNLRGQVKTRVCGAVLSRAKSFL